MKKFENTCLGIVRDEEGEVKYYKILKSYIDNDKCYYWATYLEAESICEEYIEDIDNITINEDDTVSISDTNALGEAINAFEKKVVSLVINGERIEIESLRKTQNSDYAVEDKGNISDNIKEEVEKISEILNCSFTDAVYVCSKYLEDIAMGGVVNDFDMYEDDWKEMGLEGTYLLYVGNNKDMDYTNIVISTKVEDMHANFDDYAKIFSLSKDNFDVIQGENKIKLWSDLTTLGDIDSVDYLTKKYYENEKGIINKISVQSGDKDEEIVISY